MIKKSMIEVLSKGAEAPILFIHQTKQQWIGAHFFTAIAAG